MTCDKKLIAGQDAWTVGKVRITAPARIDDGARTARRNDVQLDKRLRMGDARHDDSCRCWKYRCEAVTPHRSGFLVIRQCRRSDIIDRLYYVAESQLKSSEHAGRA